MTTSKLQLDVSKTFERLGFDHVVEHTITLRDLANNHGIRVPPKPIKIFSIDIANVEEMIAFEVDGPTHFVTRIDLQSEKERGEGIGTSKTENRRIICRGTAITKRSMGPRL